MAYSETSDEEVELDDPNLDAALHQAEQLLGIPPDPNEYVHAIPACLKVWEHSTYSDCVL